jgi:hypothetical protein
MKKLLLLTIILISNISLANDFEGIKTKINNETGEVYSITDYVDGIRFIKVTKDKASKIYIEMMVVDEVLKVGKKGMKLFLENEKTIEKPFVRVDVEVKGKYYIYSSFIEITKDEIELLKENKIVNNRLYIFYGKIKDTSKLTEYLKLLTK